MYLTSIFLSLFLGGYNKANAARLWTAITATILNTPVSSEIPEHKVSDLFNFFEYLDHYIFCNYKSINIMKIL